MEGQIRRNALDLGGREVRRARERRNNASPHRIVGAGLWAQWLEGSSKLLRPFGWYGGVIGGVLGAFAAGVMGAPILALLAAFAIAAPWIQLLGRFRCLVQGCCHFRTRGRSMPRGELGSAAVAITLLMNSSPDAKKWMVARSITPP